jgi:xanthine dehydrogenase iron-sulfur cluster and FAD-binding subunit A
MNEMKRTYEITMTAAELATILHGLRMVQAGGRLEGCAAGDCEHFDEVTALTAREIDDLCERVNFAAVTRLDLDALARRLAAELAADRQVAEWL